MITLEFAVFIIALATFFVDVAIFLLLADWKHRDLARDKPSGLVVEMKKDEHD